MLVEQLNVEARTTMQKLILDCLVSSRTALNASTPSENHMSRFRFLWFYANQNRQRLHGADR